MSSALEGGFLTTGPLGKSPAHHGKFEKLKSLAKYLPFEVHRFLRLSFPHWSHSCFTFCFVQGPHVLLLTLFFFFFHYKLSFLNFNIHLPFVIGQNIYTLMHLMSQSCLFLYTIRINVTGLPWWLSGKESSCQCRRHRFDSWSGKIPHAAEQLSLCSTTTELVF